MKTELSSFQTHCPDSVFLKILRISSGKGGQQNCTHCFFYVKSVMDWMLMKACCKKKKEKTFIAAFQTLAAVNVGFCISGKVQNGCKSLNKRWNSIIGVGFMADLASWKDGDPFLALYLMMTLTQKSPVTIFPLYSANSDVNLFKFFQKVKMNSSDVDKRTRLISCRCVSELCEGTLCCPGWREIGFHTGESSMSYEQSSGDPAQLVLTD